MDQPRPSTPRRDRIAAHLAQMQRGLIERRLPVRLALLAALAGEHVVLIGPPGTAKSEICRRLATAFSNTRVFERLMTRFSVPEELFGPLSLSALERDQYLRLTEGYLPSAHLAFLDEIFKANSAILNALLTVLNERQFDNGVERISIPLVAVVAAANEVPREGELMALYDRFTVRCQVAPVSKANFAALLQLDPEGPPASAQAPEPFSLEELAEIRDQARALKLSGGVIHLIGELREWLHEQGIYVSDRRWLRVVKLLKAAAFTEGRKLVLWTDCLLLPSLLWAEPEQEQSIRDWLSDQLIELVRKEPLRYERMVASYEALLDDPNAGRVQQRDKLGRRLFRGLDGQPSRDQYAFVPRTNDEDEALFRAPGQADGEHARSYNSAYLFKRFFKDDLEGFDAYISDPANLFYDRVELPPLMGAAAGESYQSRARQVIELASDLANFIAAIQSERAEDSEALWVADAQAKLVRAAMVESEAAMRAVFVRVKKVGERLAERGQAP